MAFAENKNVGELNGVQRENQTRQDLIQKKYVCCISRIIVLEFNKSLLVDGLCFCVFGISELTGNVLFLSIIVD